MIRNMYYSCVERKKQPIPYRNTHTNIIYRIDIVNMFHSSTHNENKHTRTPAGYAIITDSYWFRISLAPALFFLLSFSL